MSDGCGIKCARFRPDADSSVICGYCNHDISAHSILGFIQDGKVMFLPPTAAEPVMALMVPKEITVDERKQLFHAKQKVSLKRKSMGDHVDSRRSVGGRSAESPQLARNVVKHFIMMERGDFVPQTVFDHSELNENYLVDFQVTSFDSLNRFLKLNVAPRDEKMAGFMVSGRNYYFTDFFFHTDFFHGIFFFFPMIFF